MASFLNSISEKNFKTPDMGDYYDEELVEELLGNIDPSNPKSAAYYVEEPFTTNLGYHPHQEVFVLKADPIIKRYDSKHNTASGEKAEDLNGIDGDTMQWYLDSVEDGGEPFVINGEPYNSFKEYAYAKSKFSTYKSRIFITRFIGINAPEVPHYGVMPFTRSDIKENITIREAKKEGYFYEKNKVRGKGDDSTTTFVFNSGKWCEAEYEGDKYPYSTAKELDGAGALSKPGVKYYKVLMEDDQTEQDVKGDINLGILAKQKCLELLNAASDMRIIIDASQLSSSPKYSEAYKTLMKGWTEDNSLWEIMQATYKITFGEEMKKYTGFTTFGQDSFKRFLGAVYVKAAVNGSPETWINVAKYVKAQVGDSVRLMDGLTPFDQANNNGLSDAFKTWTYDNSKLEIADGFYKIGQADFDDRRSIQKEITGLDFATYRDYTVMIGDCLFMIPPTSIRVVNQIESDRVPLLRSKGSMVRTKPHNDRMIEMTLYFNGKEGINGVPIKKQLPKQNGTSEFETYYMNGLRSLIAMFRYTPFLPVENAYLNDTLGIEAVSLANIQVQTMPMYPQCLAVTLTLQQFNYRVYLNELPLPNPEEGQDFNTNMFSRTINYGVMRYYYQRAIKSGEEIKNLDIDSQDYIEATMGNKTRLIPMEFKNQAIEFQLLDENWLEKMRKVKELAARQPLQQTQPINERTVDWANRIGVGMSKIVEALNNLTSNSSDTIDPVTKLKQELIGTCPGLIDISASGAYSFKFDTSPLTSEELKNLMSAITAELEIEQGEDGFAFEDGVLKLTIEKADMKGNNQHYKCVKDDYYSIAGFFAYRSGIPIEGQKDDIPNTDNWDNFSTVSNEEFYQKLKDKAIDTETLLSAKFNKYPIEIITQQFSISMGNTFSNTKLKAHEGYAPQYAGGQDTVIDFVFHTTDKSTVTLLNSLQQMAADQLIKYRKVINCWPIRINSEMTRLCGINEVVIESIDISTVPMQPGLFAIQVRALSVDRTMRNKEALKRIDEMNNSGSKNPEGSSSFVYKTYFDLNNTLSKAEVYPDLELPTIDELDSTGYKFIRYMKSKGIRVYPDPDFYFVYGYAYSSQILRKVLTDYFKKNSEGKAPIADVETIFSEKNSKQEVKLKMETASEDDTRRNVIFHKYLDEELETNYKASRKKDIENINAARTQAGVEEHNDDMKKIDDVYKKSIEFEDELLAMQTYSFDVCSKIKCTLPENIPVDNEDNKNNILKELRETKDKIIKIIDDILAQPIDTSNYEKDILPGLEFTQELIHRQLVDQVEIFIKDKSSIGKSHWADIFNTFGVELTDELKENISYIYGAAAMALSSNTEYGSKASAENYCSRSIFASIMPQGFQPSEEEENDYIMSAGRYQAIFPYSTIVDPTTGDRYNANTKSRAIMDGVTFGPFQIRKYDASFLRDFYKDENIVFAESDFLDPYYNKAIQKAKNNKAMDQTEYKTNIIDSQAYAITAFHRLVLLWIRKLIKDDNYLSIFDVRRDDITKELNDILNSKDFNDSKDTELNGNTQQGYPFSQNASAEYHPVYVGGTMTQAEAVARQNPEKNSATTNYILQVTDKGKELVNLTKKYDDSLVLGKVFLAIMCAVTNGDTTIYSKIKSRDVGTLKAKIRACQVGEQPSKNISDGERSFRKLVRGIAAPENQIISGLGSVGGESQTKLDDALIDKSERLWMKASEDPSLWVLHSFYDMIMSDKRGRMARAFPTYYMLLIDEGRQIGYWKLHDNFYNMSSITELEVVKSRKSPADTARIVMTNMFKTFSTDDEDVKINYEHNLRDVFNSIFSPNVYFEEEEQKRMQQMNVNKVVLRPGARIHLRMGYSGNAAELPVLFNGVVAEANTGELIEIVAQSDGHEIINQQAFAGTTASDAADLENESSGLKWIYNFFTEGATPKELIRNILTTKSGFWGNVANKITNGRFFNDNAFGITHFGELDYKAIHKNGEIMQNIYAAEGRMPWHESPTPGSLAEQYATAETPEFTVELKDKSVWDVLNICASSTLEFITGVTTFGLRSTIFFGRPHYYYAYDYGMTDEGNLYEKRKPFQQYHLVDSFSDIIGNNIVASGSDIKTVAVPIYKGPKTIDIGDSVEKKCRPMWADWDIYPEFQKTMVVNTGMTWKANKAGALFINSLRNKLSTVGGEKIAWRMGATALKNSCKDMYKGEVMIIGDTSIKPLDRVFLHDIYENMDGAFEVEAVVHRLDPVSGFTTSVFPDCICTVDSRYEKISQMWTRQIASQIAFVKTTQFLKHITFGGTTRPILNFIADSVGKTTFRATSLVQKAAGLIGKEDLISYTAGEKWAGKFYKSIGLTTDELTAWTKSNQLKKINDLIKSIDVSDASTAADLIDGLKGMIKATDGVTPEDIAKMLEGAVDNKTVKKGNIESVQDAIRQLKELGGSSIGSSVEAVTKEAIGNLEELKKAGKLSKEAEESLDILKSVKNFDSKNLTKTLDALDDVKDILQLESDTMKDLAKVIAKSGDEIGDIAKATGTIVKDGEILGSVTTGAASAVTAAGAIAVAAEIAIMYVLEKSIYNAIENTMASFNVLTFYPLKKNGAVMVAGIDGHKGSVAGSPTWNQEGVIDGFINWAFKDRDGVGGWILNNLVFSDEMKAIAKTYKKDNQLGNYAYQEASTINDLLKTVAESEASSFSSYKSMIEVKRVTDIKSAAANYTYKKVRVQEDDIKNLSSNSIICNDLVPIHKSNPALEKYFTTETLKLVHEQPYQYDNGKATENKIDPVTIEITSDKAQNHKLNTQGFKISDKEVDIPMLRPDAFQVFKRLIDLILKRTGNKGYGDNEKVTIWLKSGTVVNSNSWSSTGYIFRFEVPEASFGDTKMKEVFDEASKELKSMFKEDNIDEDITVFQYRKLKNSNAYEVCVYPRDEYFRLKID